MNLTAEKEKIKKEIDLIDDERVIKAIKKLLAGYEDDHSSLNTVNESPIEDWEMATPLGRTPTDQQRKDWIDRIDDDEDELSGEDALKHSLDELRKLKSKK